MNNTNEEQIKEALISFGWTPPSTESIGRCLPKLPGKVEGILHEFFTERCRAGCLHPNWPENIVKQVAIMAGEAGEALQAALHYDEGRGDIDAVREELIQAGAMVLRCLEHLEGV